MVEWFVGLIIQEYRAMAKLGRVRDLRFQNFSPRKKIVFFILQYSVNRFLFPKSFRWWSTGYFPEKVWTLEGRWLREMVVKSSWDQRVGTVLLACPSVWKEPGRILSGRLGVTVDHACVSGCLSNNDLGMSTCLTAKLNAPLSTVAVVCNRWRFVLDQRAPFPSR